jgi:hypothetical protein
VNARVTGKARADVVLPFVRACDNPFSTDRVLAVRYRPIGWTWDWLMSRLAALAYRAAIVGPEGAGKTTLLEDLEPRLRALGFEVKYLRLDREIRQFSREFLHGFFASVSSRDIILFDGCEQMTWWGWRRFLWRSQRAGGLIVTTHAAGRLPTLVECGTTVELLGEIALTLAPDIDVDLSELFSRHRGNVRTALRELYDRYSTLIRR